MKNQELQLGLSHELSPQMVVGARYIWKDLLRAIEDVGVLVPGVGEVFYIANPGEGVAEFILADECPTCPAVPKAKRDYKGLELTFQKRYSDNWALYLSYTISRLYGNYSGLASSDEDGRTSPNVNRFFDALYMTFDRNAELVYGRLGTTARTSSRAVHLRVPVEHDAGPQPVHRPGHPTLRRSQRCHRPVLPVWPE